ncbi:alpha/beta hydrolase [Glaciihabitans arcticus]|uniref:Alpha/beta hydrolase n=1 Tax=Glaciihabitans arcticus TaxID=2668039 RepID=A0A4Q9GUA0_9MICO|nr:alpha/beta hydrolase [Glaciihabitans arcticus]TBN55407.1 alpha/beta hydrolase [Glaciihabitans arcticus]
MKRLLTAASLATVATLLLGGCTLFGGGGGTSTPTGEDVAAELEPFYSQVLEWSSCAEGMQCATAKAPLDWADPSRDDIDLALVRQLATGGNAKGSLLINPGGPGASGVSIVRDSVDFVTTERLQAEFDIVGFDPRGVGESSAVSCYTDPADFDEFIYSTAPGEVGTDEWIDALETSSEQFGKDCLAETGDLLEFIDTESAARDMDLLRAVLGDKKLNYLGFSYGTELGATYASLYPEKTGRLVLDGAVDPNATDAEQTVVQAAGFESALRAFLADCIGGDECVYSGTVDAAMVDIAELLERLSESPLRADDGRELSGSVMTTAIIYPLYSEDSWPYLRQLLALVNQGDTEFAFILADAYNGRDSETGDYLDNSLESRIAITCLDSGSNGSREDWAAEAAVIEKAAPTFGKQFGYGGTTCARWPFPQKTDRVEIAAPGSADIIVVGTTNDPATPYVWAEALAKALVNGHLVTREGEGHTGYNKDNDCVDDAVDDYFLEGTVPAKDPLC